MKPTTRSESREKSSNMYMKSRTTKNIVKMELEEVGKSYVVENTDNVNSIDENYIDVCMRTRIALANVHKELKKFIEAIILENYHLRKVNKLEREMMTYKEEEIQNLNKKLETLQRLHDKPAPKVAPKVRRSQRLDRKSNGPSIKV